MMAMLSPLSTRLVSVVFKVHLREAETDDVRMVVVVRGLVRTVPLSLIHLTFQRK
jgi:hypothetical protein